MLTAVVSGDRANIFVGLHDDAITQAADRDLPTPVINFTQFCNFLRPLNGRRISRTVTLSREN